MVQVKVKEGLLEGAKVENKYGGTYYSFKGIPYAEPPVGELRFRAPKPKKQWNGVHKVTTFSPVCPQKDLLFNTNEPSSEDCLYLNVYSPDIKPETPLPVMVWIHGGGFFCGSGNDNYYGPQFLIRRNVVLVTFNYRLGALGFLCLETEDIPGNAGMKDQVAALRWVKENITNFGGDSENVTIFGESAGGASVSYHLSSAMSNGLFKRAILQSGVSSNCWAKAESARDRALLLAKNLGCVSKDDYEIANFLRSVPVESLVNLSLPVTIPEKMKDYPQLYFSVVDEKKFGDSERFFDGDRFSVHENIDIMVGYTQDEGVIMFKLLKNVQKAIEQANSFIDYFVPKPLSSACSAEAQKEIGKTLKDFYFKENTISIKSLELLIRYFSFAFFTYEIIRWARIITSKQRNQIYMYKFTCKSEQNVFTEIFGGGEYFKSSQFTCHADDISYLFKIANKEVDMNSKEFEMINAVTKLWTDFAANGNPTSDPSLGVTWPTYNLDEQKYLNIGEKLSVEENADKEHVEFWDNIYDKYLPHEIKK